MSDRVIKPVIAKCARPPGMRMRFGWVVAFFLLFPITIWASDRVPDKDVAELIVLDAKAKLEPVEGTGLRWVSGIESSLFLAGDEQYYYLVSGRWFRTKNLDAGPWTFARMRSSSNVRPGCSGTRCRTRPSR